MTASATPATPLPPRMIALRAADNFVLNACSPTDPHKGVRETLGNNRGPEIDNYKTVMGYPAKEPLPWCAISGGCQFLVSEKRINAELAAAGDTRRVALPDWFPRSAKQNSAACASYKQAAKDAGVWVPVSRVIQGKWQPRKGDIVIFDWDAKPGNDHFGIVLAFDTNTHILSTCEGNTTPMPGVSRESNKGDGVWSKRRTLGQTGVGGGFVMMDR